MNSSISYSQECIKLRRRMKMMVEKIENFNQSGRMEGATAIGTKHFTSMKQDVLDLCESRYDAKMKKCCEEQSLEDFDELQVRMKAFLAKMKCYNKCVKIAKSEAASKQRSSKKEKQREKLPQISPQTSGGTQDSPMLVKSVAAVSLTMVDTKESQQKSHEDSSSEQATLSPATNARSSSRLKNSPEISGLFREFPLSTKSTAFTTATSSLSDLVNAKQRDEVQQPSPPTGVKQRAKRIGNVLSGDLLSQWNTDSEFLVTGDRHTKPYSSRRHLERSSTTTSRLRNRPKWVEPRSNEVLRSGYAMQDTKRTANAQEWCFPLTSSPYSKHGNTAVKHSMPDRKSIHDTLRLVRTKLLPRDKRPVNEQQSSVTESTGSDITPSLFDTTQDDVLSSSSLTSHGQDRSITTDSVEYETSTQECSTSAGEYATSERNSTVDSEEFPVKSRALDYATVPEINPIAMLTRYKDFFEGKRLPELSSEMSASTSRDQDTVVESVSSNRSLESRQSRSTVISSEECTVQATTSEGNSTIGSEDYPRKSSVLHTGFQSTSAGSGYHGRALPDSYQEQETPVESDSYYSQGCGHEMESEEYATSERGSTIVSEDYPQKSTTEFEDFAVSEINSSSTVQAVYSNTVVINREYAESTSERDYSTIASADYPTKSDTDFEEYAVSEIASTCDTSNWQEGGQSSHLSDPYREQVKLPPPTQAGTPLLDTRELIECSPRASRRHKDVTATVISDEYFTAEQSQQHEIGSLPEDNVPDRVTEHFASDALSLTLLGGERREYDFEQSVYETYHRIIGPTDSQDYDSPENYSTSKKTTKKSSMKRREPSEGNGALRERSVSVKSVRFSTDSSPQPYQEKMDDDGYSRSTGCLHRGKSEPIEYVTSATRANSSQRVDSGPHQSLIHHDEEYYPPEIATPPIRHHKSEHRSIDNSAPNQTTGSDYYSRKKLTTTKAECSPSSTYYPVSEDYLAEDGVRDCSHAESPQTTWKHTDEHTEDNSGYSNRDPERPRLKRKKKPSKHKHLQLHEHGVRSDVKVRNKLPEDEQCPDFESDERPENRRLEYPEAPMRQEHGVENDQRRVREPHSIAAGTTSNAVNATRRTGTDSSSNTHMESVEWMCTDELEGNVISTCASRTEHMQDCQEPEDLLLVKSRPNSFEGEHVTNPPTESQTVSNSPSQRVSEGLQSKKTDVTKVNLELVKNTPTSISKKRRKWRFKFHRYFLKGLTFNMQFPRIKNFYS